MEQSQVSKEWSQIVAKCWADEQFKQRFIANPAAVLAEYGIPVGDEMKLKVVENTEAVTHIILPPKPSSEELDDAELESVSGGVCWTSCWCEAPK